MIFFATAIVLLASLGPACSQYQGQWLFNGRDLNSWQRVSVRPNQSQPIQCPSGLVIFIREATLLNIPDTCSSDVRISVEGLCARRESCDLDPTRYNAVGRLSSYDWKYYYNPETGCQSAEQALSVEYSCGPPPKFKEAFQVTSLSNYESVTLGCASNERVEIKQSYIGNGYKQVDATISAKAACTRSQPNYCSYSPSSPQFLYDPQFVQSNFTTVNYYCCPEVGLLYAGPLSLFDEIQLNDGRKYSSSWWIPGGFFSVTKGIASPSQGRTVGATEYYKTNTITTGNLAVATTASSSRILASGPGQDLLIPNCTNGNVIDVQWAYSGFGTIQDDVTVQAKAACHMKSSCTFQVAGQGYGDASGRHIITLGYKCRARQWNDLTYIWVKPQATGVINCRDRYITIGEAFYGSVRGLREVTASHVWDRCEYRWPGIAPNGYCTVTAQASDFGDTNSDLYVGYYCDASGTKRLPDNGDNNRRLRTFHNGMDGPHATSRWQASYYTPCGEELMFGEEDSFVYDNTLAHATGFVPLA